MNSTSHVSWELSLPSRQLPAGRRPSAAGGPGARGAERSERRGPRPPLRALSAPPSGWRPGQRGGDGGAGGEALPRAAARPFQGEGPCSWGLSPSVPPGQRGSSGAECTASARAPLSPGSESQPPPPTAPPLPAPPAL